MKEAIFIRQNTEKWKRYEACLLQIVKQSPDGLADMYIDITNDLSFSRTYYPTSKTTAYLNKLSSKIHQYIYGKKRERWSRFITFWTQEVPLTMYNTRKELLVSFLIFAASMLLGAFSAAHDENFVRLILGDRYVDMTIDNIESGDPMGVYKDSGETAMFLQITGNNVRVSFNMFIAGVLTAIATTFLLLYNGVMLGAFQYFFYEYGLLFQSVLTVWIHGTLEISAIIIAGAASLAMGNGWLFPGTYTRLESFRRGAKRGVKIIAGLIPIFIIAGFLESFVTRHTEMPVWLSLCIILGSLAFVIFYFIIYPGIIPKKQEEDHEQQRT